MPLMIIPNTEAFKAWDKGIVTDQQLEVIETFFRFMYDGSGALGDRYHLATREFRVQWENANSMQQRRAVKG